mmetsp:Transcript_22260/g.56215  ORF Transcript_22260/g.56215 Transcript_22260/m.56215 type:complete len:261 (+) Transcript_22260:3121-3903(+)
MSSLFLRISRTACSPLLMEYSARFCALMSFRAAFSPFCTAARLSRKMEPYPRCSSTNARRLASRAAISGKALRRESSLNSFRCISVKSFSTGSTGCFGCSALYIVSAFSRSRRIRWRRFSARPSKCLSAAFTLPAAPVSATTSDSCRPLCAAASLPMLFAKSSSTSSGSSFGVRGVGPWSPTMSLSISASLIAPLLPLVSLNRASMPPPDSSVSVLIFPIAAAIFATTSESKFPVPSSASASDSASAGDRSTGSLVVLYA